MIFSDILGQPWAVDLCQKWLKQGSTNPLLFFGPEGVGKRSLGLALASALNCLKEPGVGCGECSVCHRIEVGSHPDVRVVGMAFQAMIRDEDVVKQQHLRMETIQAERHRLLQSALEGPWKVLILDEAHRLTADAANALLKVLEEPPDRTLIVLTTTGRERLFSTLVSRCRPVRFCALSDDDMARWQAARKKKNPDHEVPESVLPLAGGSPGRALHWSVESRLEALNAAESLWQRVAESESPALLRDAEGKARGARLTRPDVEERLHALQATAHRALERGEMRGRTSLTALEEALVRLQRNVSPALVYDHALLALKSSADEQTR